MLRISAIVMASGMSKRMMSDKLHLKINDKYIYMNIFWKPLKNAIFTKP